MSLDLQKALALGLRNKDPAESPSSKRAGSVDPEDSVESDVEVHGGEELQGGKDHEQVEGGSHRAEDIPHFLRQHLPQEEVRYAGVADGVADHVDDETEQRNPLQLAVEVVVVGVRVAEDVEESSECGKRQGHDDTRDKEKDSSSGFVDHKNGH